MMLMGLLLLAVALIFFVLFGVIAGHISQEIYTGKNTSVGFIVRAFLLSLASLFVMMFFDIFMAGWHDYFEAGYQRMELFTVVLFLCLFPLCFAHGWQKKKRAFKKAGWA